MDSSILRSKAVRTTLRVVILFIFPYLGFTLANALSQAHSEGTFATQRSLGKPTWSVADIAGGNPQTVWLEADDGQLYEGEIEECGNLEEDCWRKAESVDNYYLSKKRSECESAFNNMKSPPVDVMKCFIVIDWGAEWYGETQYALLQDGSIWYWKHSVSGLGPYGLLGTHGFMLCGGIFLGLFASLIVFLRMLKPRKVLSRKS